MGVLQPKLKQDLASLGGLSASLEKSEPGARDRANQEQRPVSSPAWQLPRPSDPPGHPSTLGARPGGADFAGLEAGASARAHVCPRDRSVSCATFLFLLSQIIKDKVVLTLQRSWPPYLQCGSCFW